MKKNKTSERGFFDFPIFPIPDFHKIEDKVDGKGQKSILIIYQASPNVAAILTNFLSSIFNAAKIDLLNDTYSINLTSQEGCLVSDLYKEKSIQYCFVFGLPPASIGLQAEIKLYQLTKIDGKVYLFADDIATIHKERQENGKQLSGALWKAIQQLFKK
ncbi:MAG: hypothetical protein DHS20C18_03230 [Saprospiraceae bacterium]|nr:MAG: hypothetical protein DHS20C18_03230 [Saprospiraceae bacterium]